MEKKHEDFVFFSSFRKVYPRDLELKGKQQRKYATFLDINITIEDGIFKRLQRKCLAFRQLKSADLI